MLTVVAFLLRRRSSMVTFVVIAAIVFVVAILMNDKPLDIDECPPYYEDALKGRIIPTCIVRVRK